MTNLSNWGRESTDSNLHPEPGKSTTSMEQHCSHSFYTYTQTQMQTHTPTHVLVQWSSILHWLVFWEKSLVVIIMPFTIIDYWNSTLPDKVTPSPTKSCCVSNNWITTASNGGEVVKIQAQKKNSKLQFSVRWLWWHVPEMPTIPCNLKRETFVLVITQAF